MNALPMNAQCHLRPLEHMQDFPLSCYATSYVSAY